MSEHTRVIDLAAQVFLKYYHLALLEAEVKQHTDALLFLQKIVKAHVIRQRYAPEVQRFVFFFIRFFCENN
jgi:hypothetical protein